MMLETPPRFRTGEIPMDGATGHLVEAYDKAGISKALPGCRPVADA
jgi:hypothetical protein